MSLFYTIDNDNYTSIDHVIDLQQDFRTVQKNIPFQVYLDKDRDRKSIQFHFFQPRVGICFFSRYEHIDVLFQALQWMILPSTLDIQWQRLLLGSLIWEDLYYGDVPLFEQFRTQVAQDHKDLLSHIRSGLDDPYVFLALLVAQERGFTFPLTYLQLSKHKPKCTNLHLYISIYSFY